MVGGVFLIGVATLELRSLRRRVTPVDAPLGEERWGPTAVGVAAVLLNPGAWLFFATTASAVLATAAADAGRTAAVATAVAITVGVSSSDLLFSVAGSGGRRIVGERGLRWIRIVLALALVVIGAAFVAEGVRG